MPRLAPLAALALLVAGCGGAASPDAPPIDARPFDARRAFDHVRTQVEIGPRARGSTAGGREVRFIVSELRRAGVRDVRVQRPYRNVIASIPGSEPGTIVLGTHHDTKDLPRFVGANNGGSGVAVLLELARDLPPRLDGASIDLAFFDAEEARGDIPFERDGTRGSRQFVAYAAERRGVQGSPPLDTIRAAVIFDMVGDCDLHVPLEANSDPELYAAFASADPDVFSGTADPILDDHIPFLEAGIPAVNLIDFDYGPGPTPGDWWLTLGDTLDHVCAKSLGAVGRAALEALPELVG